MVGVSVKLSAAMSAKQNIWAPWRLEYIRSLSEKVDGCFLCHYWQTPQDDAENLVLWRRPSCMALLNRFPYTAGHFLIAVGDHFGDLHDVSDETMHDIMQMSRDLVTILRAEIKADGFNFGLNLGRCAGAGVPGHLHFHLVPRWEGDTNFMGVVEDVRVISQSLESLYEQLCQRTLEMKLRY